MAVTPNSVRSTRMVARAVNDGPLVLSWPIARLTGRETSRTVSVPLAVRPAAEMRPSRNEMTGNRAASRNLADRTLWLRIGFGVLKLAVSISAWMAEWVSGFAISGVAGP